MQAKDLSVVALFITEDFYRYSGTCKLCGGEKSMEIDLSELSETKLKQIKNLFGLNEPLDVIKKEIMSKVIDAAKIESKIVEGRIT